MNRKLKIAQIAPFWFDVPPKDYGGTERVVSYLTEELVRRGHNVTLFATEKSETSAKLVSPVKEELVKTIQFYGDPAFQEINNFVNSIVYKRASEFDVIHSHASFYSFYFSDLSQTPSLHTLHNQLPRASAVENEIFRKYRHLNFISISDEFRNHFDLNYVATVYHGLRLPQFPFNERGGDDLFWIGRASKHKGELEAMEVAVRTKRKLKLAVSLRPDTQEYFEKEIKPRLGEQISLLPNIKFEETGRLYGDSYALLFPVAWAEPFGLILIESMATGTPVVAYGRGSIPEIIKDGETGFIVDPADGVSGLCEAVGRIYSLSRDEYLAMRRKCRDHVEINFTVEAMVDGYEKVYEQVCTE